MFGKSRYWTMALGLVVALGAAGSPCQAAVRGLVQVPGAPGLYWVDDFGIKHLVPDRETSDVLFGARTSIAEITPIEYLRMPRGQALSMGFDPGVFNSRRDPLAIADHLPAGYWRYEHTERALETARLGERALAAPPLRTEVREEGELGAAPVRSAARQERGSGAEPVWSKVCEERRPGEASVRTETREWVEPGTDQP